MRMVGVVAGGGEVDLWRENEERRGGYIMEDGEEGGRGGFFVGDRRWTCLDGWGVGMLE